MQGNVQVLILRDDNDNTPSNPAFGCSGCKDDGVDFYWNGSTWADTVGGQTWQNMTSMDNAGNWSYTGVATSTGWVTKQYAKKVE